MVVVEEKRERSKFAENYDHIDGCLPRELTLEILFRLPTKSLVRFKLVCKIWNSLISNPNFIKSYTLNSNNQPVTLLYDDYFNLRKSLSLGKRDNLNLNNNPTVLEINPSFFPDTIANLCHLIGSCDGLVCTYSEHTKLIYLCNPLTKETKEISLPHLKTQPYNRNDIKSMSWFGSVPSINDYKILLVYGNSMPNLRIHAYSMRDEMWRELDTSAFNRLDITTIYINWGKNMVLINETLHICLDINSQNQFMAKFDLVQEILELIPIILKDDDNDYLGGDFVDIFQDGSICICEFRFCSREEMNINLCKWMDVWKLEQYGKWDSWNKLFSFDMGVFDFRIGITSYGKLILKRGTSRNRVVEFELVLVDMTQNPTNQIQLGGVDGIVYVLEYVETLVSPFSLPTD
ncbi:F-box/kelch-repeat protein At3g23880-like [Spinacia oleracea]|uniref:F-box/kelch-repeat protein At3g23880-like n=1 Tax=Spinacia oleracea TaxID=3562 RepID=A0ABM3R1J3_SPIOL|nr:F-box/kelch-repeat protein At3g23880-like [Spinacia oleracea]